MSKFIDFGTGTAGVWKPSGTISLVKATCTGTVGASEVSATNANFSSWIGHQVFIYDAQGANVGKCEVNYITGYSTGTLSLLYPLSNTYSGASQVIVMPMYSGVDFSSATSVVGWDGTSGGIIPVLCSGRIYVNATIDGRGKGYRGPTNRSYSRNGLSATNAWTGEGYSGTSTESTSNQGNGGAGGNGGDGGGGGGGGGHATAGGLGEKSQGGTAPAGVAVGTTAMDDIFMGGGGGSGKGESNANCVPSNTYYAGLGRAGGPIFFFIARELYIDTNGYLDIRGLDGENSNGGCEEGAGGGGAGAGGSFWGLFMFARMLQNKIDLRGGIGGDGTGSFDADGGYGSNGRMSVKACQISGNTVYTGSKNFEEGGFDFCGSASQII